jgi:hypothetical protein
MPLAMGQAPDVLLASEIGKNIRKYAKAALRAYPGWIPGAGTTTGKAMNARWRLAGSAAAVANVNFLQASYQALMSWRAYRGVIFPQKLFGPALTAAQVPLGAGWGVQPTVLTYTPILINDPLFLAFSAFATNFKKSAVPPPMGPPWVPTSKSLHFLAPDLVVPMDGKNTRPVLSFVTGRASFPAMTAIDFCEIYSFFTGIAQAAGPGIVARLANTLSPQGAPRMGLARVIDLAVVGCWVVSENLNAGLTISPAQFVAQELAAAPGNLGAPQLVNGSTLLKEVKGLCALVRRGRKRGIAIALQAWQGKTGNVVNYFELAAKPGDPRQWVKADSKVTFLAEL